MEEEREVAANAFKRIRDFLFKSTNELRRIDEEAAALERDLASAEGGFGKGGGALRRNWVSAELVCSGTRLLLRMSLK